MSKLITLNAFAFYALTLAGIVFHVIHRWASGTIQTSVLQWFVGNPKSTVAMLMTVYGAVITLIAQGAATDPSDTMQVLAVWGIAYMGNSAINKEDVQS